MDVTVQLANAIGWPDLTNPWQSNVLAIGEKSIIAMRYYEDGDGTIAQIRRLTGKELLGLVGWCERHWKSTTHMEDQQFLTRLAAQSISAHVLGPAMMTTMNGAGWHATITIPTDRKPY